MQEKFTDSNIKIPIVWVYLSLVYRSRETLGSCLGPSYYFDVYNYEGDLIYKVQGPTCYPFECKRDNVAVFKVQFIIFLPFVFVCLFLN